MRLTVAMAELSGATELIDVTSAHIDACLFHGYAGLDFAEALVRGGGQVRIPTTLNVSSLDLLHPERYIGDPETGKAARRLMDAYVALGCTPTWTCAPYQLTQRPGFGEHIAWAESNAIVFANSVLGARTGRYGDFIDICAALTGRVPLAGLHLTENRRARAVFDASGLPEALLAEDVCYALIGHVVGAATGTLIPAISGLPAGVNEDRLKAVGAAAASSGSVALFHAVGSTPEAPTLEAALQGSAPELEVKLTLADLRAARDELTTTRGGTLVGVNVGTPHFSVTEFESLVRLLDGRTIHPEIEFYASTGRDVLAQVQERGWLDVLERAGVRIVTDTCTYITPVLRRRDGVVLTCSAKWAYYAPGNLGVEVAFGSLAECVESAIEGRIVHDRALWHDA
jgi:predicted aconitase